MPATVPAVVPGGGSAGALSAHQYTSIFGRHADEKNVKARHRMTCQWWGMRRGSASLAVLPKVGLLLDTFAPRALASLASIPAWSQERER